MAMAEYKPKRPDIFAGPPCARCGAAARLLSVAHHKRRKRSLMCIFECTACCAIEKQEMLIPRRPH
jgi:hypothetical protein